MATAPSSIRAAALAAAREAIAAVTLPPGTALAATGSFARGEMTSHSDLDLVLLCPEDERPSDVEAVWYPLWNSGLRVDHAVRTPRECAQLVGRDPTAALALLDLVHVRGEADVSEHTRALVLDSWRRTTSLHGALFLDAAIQRWRRAGSVVAMTRPDIKNGRGGLRDLELLRAIGLSHSALVPDLSEQRKLLLDVRTLLHEFARRRRDVLDPEFAADIADELGFHDRYQLAAAIAESAREVDRQLKQALSAGFSPSPARRNARRTPLDVDVVDGGGAVVLAKRADLSNPLLPLRVASAAARTGLPVPETVWRELEHVPHLEEPWSREATADFLSILDAPEHVSAVVRGMDDHGLWVPLVPEWEHARGWMPREPSHVHTVDEHLLVTVSNCASNAARVARPDLLVLAALYHDLGKGYGVPHEEQGAQFVGAAARRLRLSERDRAVVVRLVREHTRLADIARHHDPDSDSALAELLEAVDHSRLILELLAVLTEADSRATGPGVWTPSLAAAARHLTHRARIVLEDTLPAAPEVRRAGPLGLFDRETVYWHGPSWRASLQLFATLAAGAWQIYEARVVKLSDATIAANLTVLPTVGGPIEEPWLVQSYNSGVYTQLPEVPPGEIGFTWRGDIVEMRCPSSLGTIGRVVSALPDIAWLRSTWAGNRLVVQCALPAGADRSAVERNVTAALNVASRKGTM